MYTLVNIATGLVQEINVSESDFQAGNYIDAGKGLVGHYIEDNITGTPRVGTTKFDKPTASWVMLTWSEIRTERDRLLKETDHIWGRHQEQLDIGKSTGIFHLAHTDAELHEILVYRRTLRDIPQDYPDRVDVVFPSGPTTI